MIFTPEVATAAALLAFGATWPPAIAQSSQRTTVLKNAPLTSIALPGTSASISINSGTPVDGNRTVVVKAPLVAVPVWPFKAQVRIASN